MPTDRSAKTPAWERFIDQQGATPSRTAWAPWQLLRGSFGYQVWPPLASNHSSAGSNRFAAVVVGRLPCYRAISWDGDRSGWRGVQTTVVTTTYQPLLAWRSSRKAGDLWTAPVWVETGLP
jgi:hypothetical protein